MRRKRAAEPGSGRWSTFVTWWPTASRCSTTTPPSLPEPPVTTMCMPRPCHPRTSHRGAGTSSTWEDGLMRFLLRLLANAAALAVATWLVPGIRLTALGTGDKVLVLLVVALIFGVVNAIVKPIFTLVTACVVLLTLGLFLVVINALMLLLTSWLATQLGVGWHVDGFWSALVGSIIVSIVSFVLNAFLPDRNNPRRGRA